MYNNLEKIRQQISCVKTCFTTHTHTHTHTRKVVLFIQDKAVGNSTGLFAVQIAHNVQYYLVQGFLLAWQPLKLIDEWV